MGEIADDMISGLCCTFCGVYFQSEHGYPVLCLNCWKYAMRKEKTETGLQEATIPELGKEKT